MFVVAQVAPPGIVAVLEESASATGENQAIGTVKVLGFTIDAFPVTIAVSDISHDFALGLAGIRLRPLLGHSCADSMQQFTDAIYVVLILIGSRQVGRGVSRPQPKKKNACNFAATGVTALCIAPLNWRPASTTTGRKVQRSSESRLNAKRLVSR